MRTGSAVAAAAAALGVAVTGQALSQEAPTVAIDVDVAGNGPRSVGTVENCARIAAGSELKIDVVLPAPGIPAHVGIKAWQFDLLYDESVVNVVDEDPDLLLAQAGGSELFSGLSDPLPDSDGTFTSASADFGAKFQIEPDGVQEVGPGVITRLTLSAVSRGASNLTLSNAILVGADDSAIPLGNVLGAAVAVDTACQPPPSPTPGAAGGPGAETPPPGAGGAETPSGTPGDGQGADGTPGATTPGPGTPVLGGTPVPGEDGGAGGDSETLGEAEDGDGLSALAWAGIGVGIAAAALAASGAGWFTLRRRGSGGADTSGGKGGSE